MNDQAYYRNRALQEKEAMRAATCEKARERHAELADAYDLRSRLLLVIEMEQAEPPANDAATNQFIEA